MSFSVYHTTYYNNNDNSYQNILILNELPNDLLKPYIQNIKINNISPFQTNNNYNKCVYAFIDSNVYDGIEYTYSVAAYDIGIPKSDTLIINNSLQITNIEDPGGWGKIGAYSYLENSKGTTIHDVNFTTVIPGYQPVDEKSFNKIKVVPNPYIINSDFNETEYISKLRFTNLPKECKIKIFTITGEFIYELNHYNDSDANIFWDLRTINNQEIAPGLYLYSVTTPKGNAHIGKFAIVR